MLTLKLLREQPEYVIKKLAVKNFDAKEIVEKINALDADRRALQTELDCYNGVVVYEVEFAAGGKEYDYEINAKTGMLVDYEIDYDDDDDGRADDTSSGAAYIGAAAAKKVAFEHSGVSGIVRELEIDLETENGKIVYEVQFKQGGMEYDYKIDALTGSILFRETEKDGDWYDDSSDISGGTSQDIGAEEALKAAKKHGGISGEVYESEIDRETENGKLTFYADKGEFTGEPIEKEYFGCGGVARIDDLQRKLIVLARNGFRHHTAIGKGDMTDILREAFTTYLGYDMIEL